MEVQVNVLKGKEGLYQIGPTRQYFDFFERGGKIQKNEKNGRAGECGGVYQIGADQAIF